MLPPGLPGVLTSTTRVSARDRGAHCRDVECEVVGAVQRHGPHAQAERPGDSPVADVHGLRHEDLVAGIHEAGQDGVDGVGRPRKNDDLVGITGMIRRLGFESRDGGSQRRLTLGGRVVRAVVLHRRQGLVEDGFRRREIGVADAQQDDVLPGRLQRQPLVVDGPAVAIAAGQPLRDLADLHRMPPSGVHAAWTSRSISSGSVGTPSVSTSGSPLVTATSSSIRMPMPCHSLATPLVPGGM